MGKSNKWKEYDYVKIPTKNCVEFTEEYDNGYYSGISYKLEFLGEPIFEKEIEKTSSVSINSNGISIGGIVKDDKLFDDYVDSCCSVLKDNNSKLTRTTIKVDNTNKNMEGENKMNELLNIYKRNEIDKIDKKYNEIKEDVLRNDEIVKAAEDYNIALKNNICDESLIYEYKISTDRIISTASKNELIDIEIEHEKECQNICDFIKMVQSHLDITDNFEQKQEILKAYHIINNDGTLNIFDNKEEIVDVKEEPFKKARRSK